MKYFWYIAAVITMVYCGRGFFSSPTQEQNEGIATTTPTPQATASLLPMLEQQSEVIDASQVFPETSIVMNNTLSAEEQFEDEIIICVAYTENFRPNAYKCCGQWLIGYGQARINGKLVHAGQTISELEAQQEVRRHLRKYVYPVVNAIDRPMTDGEYITCCLLAYNMGTGGFKKSSFYKAFSTGKSQEECLKYLKGTGGVAKRRWVDAALFTGAIEPYDLLELSAGSCYNFRKQNLYHNGVVDMTPEKVDEFLTSPLSQRGKELIRII